MAMKEYEGRRDEYVSSVQTLTSLVAIAIAIIYFAGARIWNKILGLPSTLIVVMLAGFLLAPARDFWMARCRYEYRYRLPGLVSILSATIASCLAIIVVINLKNRGHENLAEARLISNYIIIYGVALVIWVAQFFKGRVFINKEFWSFSLKLSIPLIGYQFAAQILNVSDRLMIDKMVSTSAVGIYGTLYSVSSISLLVWNAINTSFVPYLFQNIDNKENRIKEISLGLLEAYGAVAVVLTFLAPEIVRILATKEYYEAIYIMPPISAGVFFTSVAHMYSNILVYYKKTKYVMYGSVIAAGLNIILNAIFIPIYGYMAAAYTTLIGYMVMAGVEAAWANKVHYAVTGGKERVYNDKGIILLSIITVVLSLSGLIWYSNSVLRYFVTGIAAVIAVLFLKKMLDDRKER